MTSEVGSPVPVNNSDEDQKWRDILEMQKINFIEILKTIQTSNNPIVKSLKLPKFNPNMIDADATAWCATIDLIFEKEPLEGGALIMALSGALEEEGSQWLTISCFPGITWAEFKSLFLQRFTISETLAAAVMNALNTTPKSGENISAFGNRLVNSLETKFKKMNAQEIAVAVVLAHLSRKNEGVKRLACTSNITTRLELQQELKAFSFTSGKTNQQESGDIPAKRLNLSNIQCHSCGKMGHKMAQCRIQPNKWKQNSMQILR